MLKKHHITLYYSVFPPSTLILTQNLQPLALGGFFIYKISKEKTIMKKFIKAESLIKANPELSLYEKLILITLINVSSFFDVSDEYICGVLGCRRRKVSELRKSLIGKGYLVKDRIAKGFNGCSVALSRLISSYRGQNCAFTYNASYAEKYLISEFGGQRYKKFELYILADKKLSAQQKMFLLFLIDFPCLSPVTNQQIADLLGVSKRTAIKIKQSLSDGGYIAVRGAENNKNLQTVEVLTSVVLRDCADNSYPVTFNSEYSSRYVLSADDFTSLKGAKNDKKECRKQQKTPRKAVSASEKVSKSAPFNKIYIRNKNINNNIISDCDCETEYKFYSCEDIAALKERIEENTEIGEPICFADERIDNEKELRKHSELVRFRSQCVKIILSALLTRSKHIRIGREYLPAALVQDTLLSIDETHIEYVFDCLCACKSNIRNIRAYLLTSLYNAPSTIDLYYSQAARKDYTISLRSSSYDVDELDNTSLFDNIAC